jgi:hypothetical protein
VFPHADAVAVEGQRQRLTSSRVIELLQHSVSPERLEKMKQVGQQAEGVGRQEVAVNVAPHPAVTRPHTHVRLQVVARRSYNVVPVVEGEAAQAPGAAA